MVSRQIPRRFLVDAFDHVSVDDTLRAHYRMYLQDKPRGLGFVRAHVFVCLRDFRIAKNIGCRRHDWKKLLLLLNLRER